MLISDSRRLIFVHIQKTGGTSVEAALRAQVPDLRRIGGTHDHAAWVRPGLGERWDSYFRFAFVRNPWDRLVSWYEMIRQRTRESYLLWEYARANAESFEEFLRRCTDVVEDVDGRKSFAFNQVEYIDGPDGRPLVDFVGRYEDLARDTAHAFERLGLDPPRLPALNRTPHPHYASFYDDATRDLVAHRFARDVARFGYVFEPTPEPARR